MHDLWRYKNQPDSYLEKTNMAICAIQAPLFTYHMLGSVLPYNMRFVTAPILCCGGVFIGWSSHNVCSRIAHDVSMIRLMPHDNIQDRHKESRRNPRMGRLTGEILAFSCQCSTAIVTDILGPYLINTTYPTLAVATAIAGLSATSFCCIKQVYLPCLSNLLLPEPHQHKHLRQSFLQTSSQLPQQQTMSQASSA